MIPEISIIKLFLTFGNWQKYGDLLQIGDFPKELQPLLRVLYAKHDTNDEPTDYSVSDLANLFFASNPSNREYMEGVFASLERDCSREDTVLELIQGIRTKGVLQELSMAAYDASQGKKKLDEVVAFFEKLKKSEDKKEEDYEFVTTDLEELVQGAYLQPGLRWRLQTLNRMFGSLRKGDFGFLFARPETGKTTFLASEASFMASQAESPILWLNNEEQNNKVMLRVIQAALGLPMVEILRDLKAAKQRYQELTNDNLRLMDATALSQSKIEKIVQQLRPSLIIFDQIDKIPSAQNDREDLRLGAIYQWARELAKSYAPVISVCQADGTGEGQKWLTMAHVANAKTSKQAEADWILGIGKLNDPGYDSIRYLHASKNKLMGDEDTDPALRHGRVEVLIRPELGRYIDIGD